MTINANVLKKFFKHHFGMKVFVNKVAVKHPFFQVWVKDLEGDGSKPSRYEKEFDPRMGQIMLDFIYGPESRTTFPAGNIQRNRISLNQREFDNLLVHYPMPV